MHPTKGRYILQQESMIQSPFQESKLFNQSLAIDNAKTPSIKRYAVLFKSPAFFFHFNCPTQWDHVQAATSAIPQISQPIRPINAALYILQSQRRYSAGGDS
ncbi:hypothetical protein FSHL1_000305 [Fusarium sambucinum]